MATIPPTKGKKVMLASIFSRFQVQVPVKPLPEVAKPQPSPPAPQYLRAAALLAALVGGSGCDEARDNIKAPIENVLDKAHDYVFGETETTSAPLTSRYEITNFDGGSDETDTVHIKDAGLGDIGSINNCEIIGSDNSITNNHRIDGGVQTPIEWNRSRDSQYLESTFPITNRRYSNAFIKPPLRQALGLKAQEVINIRVSIDCEQNGYCTGTIRISVTNDNFYSDLLEKCHAIPVLNAGNIVRFLLIDDIYRAIVDLNLPRRDILASTHITCNLNNLQQ
ncbi:MAG: hypothetical protein IPJ69_00270 [Deltaproteobacteria bacterium]|nr:MAG: hypothetical protein IPJ69_00270 [Deltaproteobacteria bacterium]